MNKSTTVEIQQQKNLQRNENGYVFTDGVYIYMYLFNLANLNLRYKFRHSFRMVRKA